MNKQDERRIKSITTPAYVVDERLLIKNLTKLKQVQDQTGAKILLALKGFSMYEVFPLIGEYLHGITSSSLFEAKLGHDYMGKEVHIYAPAYREDEMAEIANIADHIVFNSIDQYKRHRETAVLNNPGIEFGLRVNPEYAEVEVELYNPCAPGSRLGAKADTFVEADLDGISGLHFHTMCEQNSDTLVRTLGVVEEKFGPYLHKMKWLNFGGGHHITRDDYDLEALIKAIVHMRDTYNLQIYLEPGEAIALNTGYLVTSVLDIVKNNMEIAIVDTSAACHMPDVIEMPYRPFIIGSKEPNKGAFTYRIGGLTCLAGDIIGDYAFDHELNIGDKLIFTDMAHYTMVKNNMFNGVNLPSIVLLNNDEIRIIKEFSYLDYKSRLS